MTLIARRQPGGPVGFTVLGILAGFVSTTFAQTPDTFSGNIGPALQTYCFRCHGLDGVTENDVDLTVLKEDHLGQQGELIGKVIDVLDLQSMPPADEIQPSAKHRQQLVDSLKEILRAETAKSGSYLPTPIRRLNRFQYHNAVTDLFDLKCVVFTLPERMMRDHNGYFQPASGRMPDVVTVGSRPLGKSQLIETRLAGVAAYPQDLRAEHGFDNQADHLSLSPLLMEAFLKLGQSITESPDFHRRNVGIWDRFFAPPSPETELAASVELRLRRFLRRAFRRPVDADLLRRYTDYVLRQLDAGVAYPEAMKSVAAATLASPRFLYLYETDAAESDAAKPGTRPVNDWELATRLSYFLWGSIPDDELLDLAAAGTLGTPAELTRQVNRMLADRKLKRFCDSFPSQWLQLERIISSAPDPDQYPGFYFLKYRDSMHMMLEPLLLFETVLIENRSIADFIDSDFTYRSQLLEDAYGALATGQVPEKKRGGAVAALRFHRVPVSDRRSGGLITNAAVMTMTSGRERTKPITRGAWIAGVIFNNPPDPPPADVPPLTEQPRGDEAKLTLRERLSLHRERADCRGCHEQIDPLGFALENYNAIGVWREQYSNQRSVDVSGTLFRRHPFANVIEFKDAILAEQDRFARGFAGHLLTFALARPLGAADQPVLDRIIANAADSDYAIHGLIHQVVQSEPFRTKTIRPDAESRTQSSQSYPSRASTITEPQHP